MKVILQKYIAQSGLASRRAAEILIRQGKVFVNGKKAQIGMAVDIGDAPEVKVGGKKLRLPEEKIYTKLNKPSGYTSTARKFKGEKNVFDLIKLKERLFIVGRLDKDSRGLILLTNDGELANKLTHPRYEKEKEYIAEISNSKFQIPKREKEVVFQFTEGIDIGEGDGIVKAKKVKYLGDNKFNLVLTEGKKRQIRRMFKKLGLEVRDLVRVRIGKLELGNLKEGEWKKLTEDEIKKLK
ncbi:MAG: pseudouridine synthase [Patescibacteria group bacterium]|jgi:pseudouridine synthase